MSLIKLPFLIPKTVGFHRIQTPPSKPSAGARVKQDSFREVFIGSRWTRGVCKLGAWVTGLAEAVVICAQCYPTSKLSQTVLSVLIIDRPSAHVRVTPLFLVGCLLVVSGIFVRLQAYRALGKHFTFELSIRQDHKLVTSGPYGFVRHPSYTGLFMAYVGELCCQAKGSWLLESGVLGTSLGAGLALFWLAVVATVAACLVLRISAEESLLGDTMGKEWEAYSRRVRYKLLPGIY
ncbi:hypothetical protein PLICRDRAFT_172269 [Plicaturopsis crispa FD-325 SS-3]|nr:hypothetical protein PLICRDRAFT_172269 [Plicaturopsis crispa FD-325 SS-3]